VTGGHYGLGLETPCPRQTGASVTVGSPNPVPWVATASSRTTESNARRVSPRTTPADAITTRTASKIRSGRSEARSRLGVP
jgi:hypothetical protein